MYAHRIMQSPTDMRQIAKSSGSSTSKVVWSWSTHLCDPGRSCMGQHSGSQTWFCVFLSRKCGNGRPACGDWVLLLPPRWTQRSSKWSKGIPSLLYHARSMSQSKIDQHRCTNRPVQEQNPDPPHKGNSVSNGHMDPDINCSNTSIN